MYTLFDYQFAFNPTGSAPGQIQMIKSFDGGATWSRPTNLFTVLDGCAYIEPSIGRCTMDGVGGARDDLMPDPSVDIANGAPTGADATNQIVLVTTEQVALNDENVLFTTSTNGGATWTPRANVTLAGDRGYYTAPAISPNGTDAWIVYNSFLEPFKISAEGAANDRPLDAVVLHADVASNGAVGPFSLIHRSVSGDARGSSQNNLAAEFLGDYVYAAATRTYSAQPSGTTSEMRRTARPSMSSARNCSEEARGYRGADRRSGRAAAARRCARRRPRRRT